MGFNETVFYLCEALLPEGSKERPEAKANVTRALIKAIKQRKGISSPQMMEWCRRAERMRLTDFEEVFRRLVEVEVYF